METTLEQLCSVILQRKETAQEGSYTRYLFESGLDKILKKCGEECAEVIIAAKNGNNTDTVGELADLLYHLCVLMAQQNIPIGALLDELDARSRKIGNLKEMNQSDHNT